MSTYVTYDIFTEGSVKPARQIKNAACFAGLAGMMHSMKDSAYVLFYVDKTCTEEEVEWYALGINMIGLSCSMSIEPKHYYFYVYKTTPFPRMLATLTAIRYLQEANYPKMIKWAYKHSKENPQLEFFEIFQLMHFAIDSVHTGHGFMNGFSPYGTSYKLVTRDAFIKKLLKAASVNSTMIPEGNQTLSLAEKQKIKKHFKNGEFSEFLKLAVAKPKEVVEV